MLFVPESKKWLRGIFPAVRDNRRFYIQFHNDLSVMYVRVDRLYTIFPNTGENGRVAKIDFRRVSINAKNPAVNVLAVLENFFDRHV